MVTAFIPKLLFEKYQYLNTKRRRLNNFFKAQYQTKTMLLDVSGDVPANLLFSVLFVAVIGILKRIDRRTRMLAAGLCELFILGEDYVSMVACQDEIDVALLNALQEAGAAGRQSGELAAQLDIDHRLISRRIRRMNKRMEQEIGENIIEKHEHKWKLIPRLRRDFAAAGR